MIYEPKYSTTSNMEADRCEGWDRLKQGKNDETQEILGEAAFHERYVRLKQVGQTGNL